MMEQSHFAHSRAVVVGIDRYEHIRSLNTAVSDARRLAEFLREQHNYEDVLLLEDATRETLSVELGERLAARANEDDRLLLYFAGHGIALNGDDGPEGFLIPADAKADDRATFIAMADLYRWLDALPCRHLLVILDCCFAGAFTWYGRRHMAPIGETLYREHYDRFVREPAWQILTSAAHDQEALDVLGGRPIGARGEHADNGARHSPFADALFAALQGEADLIPKNGGDGVVTATELHLYLRQTVEVSAEEGANHRQTPELWPFSRTRHGKGEYIFLAPGHGEPALPPAPALTADNNPYRGLQSYDEKHAALFFGRRTLIEKLAVAVDEYPLIVVLGASGTGKSSVVKAGVIPYLKQRTGQDPRHDAKTEETPHTYTILPPMRPGDTPMDVLAELVATNLPGSSELPGRLAPATFIANAVESWLTAYPHQRLLLVVDQAEELITLCRDEDVRRAFLQTLADLLAVHADRLRIIFTLRTDFEPQFQDSPLTAQWREGRFIVPPMSQAELREVIENPAAVRVLFFDPPQLVDMLINEVIQTPGALPLLSFTLEQLYLKYLDRQSQAQRDGVTLERSLTQADYEELGGVIGSLRCRADEVYGDLPDDAHRTTMQRIMLRMVAVEGGELARRRVMLSELVYPSEQENSRVQTVLARMVDARLLVKGSMDVDGDGVNDTVVEPAHDALVAAWGKLLRWKQVAEEYLPLQRRLWQAVREWSKAAPEAKLGLLWDDDPRLPQVKGTLWPTRRRANGFASRMDWVRQVLWPQTDSPVDTQWLNQAEVSFIQESVKRRASTLRRVIAVTAAVIVVLSLALVFAEGQRRVAESERITNLARFLASESQNSTDAGLRTLLGIEAMRLLIDTGVEPLSDVWGALQDAVAEGPLLSLETDTDEHRVGGPLSYGQTRRLQLDPYGRLAALPRGANPGTAKLIDLQSREVLQLPELPDGADQFVVGTQSHYFVAQSGKIVYIFSVGEKKLICILLHDSYVHESLIIFDPTETRVLISGDGKANLWRISDCKQLSSIPLPDSRLSNFSLGLFYFDSRGERLFVGYRDHLEIWDISSEAAPQLMQRFAGNFVDLSENLERIAISSNGTASVFDIDNHQLLFEKEVSESSRQIEVSLSPNGRHLVTTQRGSQENRNLRLWEVDSGTEVWRWQPQSIGFSYQWVAQVDGELLITYESSTIFLYDTHKGALVPSPPRFRGTLISHIVVNSTGTYMLIALADGSVRLWNIAGNYEERKVRHTVGAFADMTFSADGNFAATTGRDGSFRTWRTSPPEFASDKQDIQLVQLGGSVIAVGESPSGNLSLFMLDQRTEPVQYRIAISGNITAIHKSAWGEHLLVGNYDATTGESALVLYDLKDTPFFTFTQQASLPPYLYPSPDCVTCISPDGRWLALLDDPYYENDSMAGTELVIPTCNYNLACVLIWDVNAGRVHAILRQESEIALGGIAFSPTVSLVATLDKEGVVRLWNLQLQPLQPVDLPVAHAYLVSDAKTFTFTPDGQYLVALGPFGSLHVWNVNQKQLVTEYPHLSASPKTTSPLWTGIVQVEFAPGSNDLIVLLGEHCGRAETPAASLPGIQIQRWNIALEPIGERLLSKGDCDSSFAVGQLDDKLLVGISTPQNTLEVWDYSSSKIKRTSSKKLFEVSTRNSITDIAFAPDGEYLTAIDTEGRIHQWPMDLQQLLHTACASVGQEMQEGDRVFYFRTSAPSRPTCQGIR